MARNTNVKITESPSITAIANALKAKMRSGVTIKPLDFAKYISKIGTSTSGTINITNLNLTDVTSYANAKITDSNLVTGNIKQGISILGVAGKNSVIDTNGGDVAPFEMAINKVAYANRERIVGTARIYVNNNTLYVPEGWIDVILIEERHLGDLGTNSIYCGDAYYSGNEIGVL